MNNLKNLIVGLLVTVVLLAGAWYIFVRETEEKPRPLVPTFNFSQEGNLVKDNPGMKEGEWYLVYDEPGAPGKSVLLKLVDFSTCSFRGVGKECDEDELEKGMRVNLQGIREGDVLTVTHLTVL